MRIIRRVHAHEREALGPDEPGVHGGDEHALFLDLVEQRLGERDDRMLRRAVDRRARRGEPPGERRDVHDVAVTPFQHPREERSGPVHHAEDVHLDDVLDLLIREVRERPAAGHTRVVHQDVARTERLVHDRGERRELVTIGHVAA